MALEAPDFNAGASAPFSLNDFLNYKNIKHQHDIQEMKDIAEFQQNLRLQGLDKQMQMANNNKLNSEAYDRTNPINLGTAPMQLENRGFNNPIAQGKLAQGQEGLDIKKAAEADKTKLGQEGLDLKTTAEGKKLSGEQQFANKQNLQQEGEGARSTLQNNLTDKRNATSIANTTMRTNTSKDNVATRSQALLDSIHARGKEARETKQTQGTSANSTLPSQDLVAKMTAAQDFINANPDLGKHVHIDPNTKLVTVDPPSAPGIWGTGGLSQTDYQTILDKLQPNRASIQMGAPQPSGPAIPPTGASAFTPNAPQLQMPGADPNTPDPTHVKVNDGKKNYFWDTTKGQIPQGYVPGHIGGSDDQSQDEQPDDSGEGEVGY